MKKMVVAALLSAVSVSSAHAQVTSLRAVFAGGCTSSSNGNCVIEVYAEGTDLETEAVRIYSGSTKDSLRLVSTRGRSLTSEGRATFRLKNTPGGCYQIRTAPNGNNKSDHSSRTICEK